MFITIKKQIKLYWVMTADHAEDWSSLRGATCRRGRITSAMKVTAKGMLEPA